MVLRLHRVIGPDGSTLDCASGTDVCELSVVGFTDPFHRGAAPLDFDPSAPPLPGPSITVVPDTDLVHKQTVTVTGSGFLPNTFVDILECTHDQGCGFLGGPSVFTTTDADGNLEAEIAVHRGLRISDGSVFDCTEPTGCDIVAVEVVDGDTGAGAIVTEPIAFDASVPPPPPLPVTADPPGPYADRQVVHVSSNGYTPGEPVFILECEGPGAAVNHCFGLKIAQVGADGSVNEGVRVRRTFNVFGLEAAIAATGHDETASADVGAADVVDCAVDECSIVVFSFGDAYANGAVPLVIDPNLPPTPPPSFVAEPTVELLDGQVLTVHGSGFSPGEDVAMIQCRAGADDDTGQACDISKTLKYATADENGNFETTFTVTRVLNTSKFGPIDCATVPEGCILGWGGLADIEFERGNVPLDFLGDVSVEGISETAPGGLPRTGNDSARLALWGVLAVAAGLGLHAASRRRRADAVPDDVEL
jgi:hypothetical protein